MFESERLVFRAPEEAIDLEWMWKTVGNNAETVRMLNPGPIVPESKEEQKKRMFPTEPSPLPAFIFCLKPQPGTEPASSVTLPGIGFLSFFNRGFNYKTRIAMVGLAIADEKLRDKGYGREALNWALEYAFMQLGLHRVELGVFSFNERAYALYKSIGFVEEGRQRKVIYDNGGWHDIILLAVLEEEWMELRKKLPQRPTPK